MRQLAVLAVLLAAAIACVGCPSALASPRTKLLHYHGYRLHVPAGWPVYRLTRDSTVCVRFNRHAVYLGNPSPSQRCPGHTVGRTEAILVQPLGASTASAGGAAARAALPAGGSLARVVVPQEGVIVTATWATDRAVIQRALGRRVKAVSPTPWASSARAAAPVSSAADKSPSGKTAVAGGVYTGLGFDPCAAPSTAAMSAWASKSPFHAVGVYIGGAEVACSQTNLSKAWVAEEAAAGWNIIPTYVGLQAPTNSCGCAGMSTTPANAATAGTAAAQDAVVHAKALGFGTGSPIYYDMEAFSLTATNTKAVNSFLSAWTTKLHAAGYLSGIYSSADSGIVDLVHAEGTRFVEPDDVWVAEWNGKQSTSSPEVPSSDWSDHQRVHQYRGGHSDTYGGQTISIDSDYLDGAVAGVGETPPGTTSPTPTATPVLSIAPGSGGTIAIHAQWIGEHGITAWRVLAGMSESSLDPLGGAFLGGQSRTITVGSQFPYFAVEAVGATGATLGNSVAAATPPHLAIYGHSAFVPTHGLSGIPVACYVPSGCSIVTTISAGRRVIARTGADPVPAGGGGLVYFKLSSSGRKLLADAPGRRLAVTVSSRNISQSTGGGTLGTPSSTVAVPTATSTANLIPFTTGTGDPPRTLNPTSTLGIVSATAFVNRDSGGAVLADCLAATPCSATVTLTNGHSTIAQTRSERLGVGALGYLTFKLTPQGRALLVSERSNQLGVHVRVSDGTSAATGRIVLVGYR